MFESPRDYVVIVRHQQNNPYFEPKAQVGNNVKILFSIVIVAIQLRILVTMY